MDGKRLMELRKESGLTQLELSKYLGVTRSLIGMVENGKQGGGREFTKKVAEYFNVSIDYLEGLTPERHEIKKEKKMSISDFLRFLVNNNVITDENNIDENTKDMIMLLVKKEVADIIREQNEFNK